MYVFTVTYTIDDFVIDYHLVKFPYFADDYFEIHSKVYMLIILFLSPEIRTASFQGAVFMKDNVTEPGFWPPQIPEFANHTEHMIYAYITDYVMNSGLTAAYKTGKLMYNVTEDLVRDGSHK
jgi:hypothetical protein